MKNIQQIHINQEENKYDTKENHQTTKGKQRKGQRRSVKSMGKQS